ncbi:MAG: nuclear transport factor 2 family protein, partial [Acidimicrobiia bacterium]
MSQSISKNLAGELAPAARIAWSWICAISSGGDMNAANDLLHDDLVYWTNLDRRSAGKPSVVKLGAWRAKFVPITFTLTRATAQGDVAVLELEGEGETARGDRYDNCYAMI